MLPISPEQTYSEEEIEAVLRKLRKQCIDQFGISRPQIQVFLPIELMHFDIDTWLLEQNEIAQVENSGRARRRTRQHHRPRFGSRHQVVLRSHDRLDPLEYELQTAWKDKWAQVKAELLRGEPVSQREIFQQRDSTQISSLGEQARALGIRLNQALSHLDNMSPVEMFETLLLDTDLPLALWVRQAEDGIDYQQELNQLLEACCLAELRETLRERRAEIIDLLPDQQTRHLWSHLALLWDDPTVQPPASPDAVYLAP